MTTAAKVALIDCDIIAVSCAAAAEKKFVRYEGQRFKNITELKAVFPNVNREEVERIVEPEPFSHARANARGLIQRILDACAPVSDFRGYISGSDNFRYQVATLKPYKGNRDRSEEPTWRKDLEAYLLAEYPVEKTQGHEADDKLAVEYCKDPHNSILCSQDKDFLQIPDLHMYNWYGDSKHVHVTPLEAARNFHIQLLKGDSTDNIAGCAGIGPAKAEEAINSLKDEKLMLTKCYTMYQKAYADKAWANMMENARLIYLCRTEEELADPMNAFKPCIAPAGIL